MKRIEKLGIGELKLCFRSSISGISGDKIYPRKSVITANCSRNQARNVYSFLCRENDGEISKIYWNGKEISPAFFKVIQRSRQINTAPKN